MSPKKFVIGSIGVLLVLGLGIWLLLDDDAGQSAASSTVLEKQAPQYHLTPAPRAPEALRAAEAEHKARRKQAGALKADSPDEYHRYHVAIRQRLDDAKAQYAPNYRVAALRRMQAARKAAQDVAWVERGPANVAGRTRGLVVDVRDPERRTWYAGSVGGGIWKTTDAGQSWRTVTPDLPNLATVTLDQARSQPVVFYAGTGEGFFNLDAVQGDGIWKSTDGGETWTQLAATAGNPEFQAVNRLVVAPTDPDVVVAATNQGLHRTDDGGATWTETLDRPAGNGAGRMQQVVASPDGFQTLYATSNQIGIYKSDDGGQTWHLAFDLQQHRGGNRLEMAVAPSAPHRLYVAVENFPDADLYMSDDRGATWTEVPEQDGDGPNWMRGQGWYDNTIAVDPFDPETVFVGGVEIWRITVSGDPSAPQRTTEQITDSRSGPPHVDHHVLVTIPDAGGTTYRLVDASDGGVAYSDDRGATWTSTNNGYNTTQFYGVDKKPGADVYIGGMQDNGTWRSPEGVTAGATTDWQPQIGGDGFTVVWHTDRPEQILATVQYNIIGRTDDAGGEYRLATEGLGDTGQDNGSPFFTTLATSKSDPDLVFVTGASGIWRSSDFADTWHRAEMDTPSAWFPGTSRIPVAVSVADPQVVWAGGRVKDDHRVFVSHDGGVSFRPTGTLPGISALVTGIATHPADPQTAYVTFAAPGHPKVIRTTSLGASWDNLTGTFEDGASFSSNGFPDVATYCMLVMPFDPDVLWAGTEIGIFVSEDGGASWAPMGSSFPSVAVWQLSVVDGQVVAATHGRGVWTATLPELAGYRPPEVVRAPRLDQVDVAPGGAMQLGVSLRSAYDSVAVSIDGAPQAILATSPSMTDTTLAFAVTVEETKNLRVGVVAYRDGRTYLSRREDVTFFPASAVQNSFTTDFDQGGDAFTGEGFQVTTETGFDSPALHSPHTYPDNTTLEYQLTVPVRVADDRNDAVLRYRDVAIVEPGEPGTTFGDGAFWDYVVVEGTTLGQPWTPLADGYDARFDANWLTIYNAGAEEKPSADDFVTHEINLHDTFAPGDVIFIRFRLVADAAVNGWGWAIDDLEIQPSLPVDEERPVEVPEAFTLEQNYPNPFNPTTVIPFTLPQAGGVTLTVYDLQGRRVATLAQGHYPAGTHEVSFDASHLASGVYLYRLETGGQQLHRTMTLVK